MANFAPNKQFDALICLCEGAFGLLTQGEDPFERDMKILRNINRALKSNAPFLLTALNGLRMIRSYTDEDVATGVFDQLGIVETHPMSNYIENAPEGVFLRKKGFVATELVLMLKVSGFHVQHIWGGTAGSWNRQPLKMDEMELMVFARKIKNDFSK